MARLKRTILPAFLTASLAGPALAQTVQTELDGRPLQFDQPAVMQEGRVMVPLRGIFESLGADVLYDRANKTIKATRGPRVVELTLGSREASVDGKLVTLDVPASTLGGRTLVPLRFVSESLGAEVRWAPATRTVSLTSSGSDSEPVASGPLPAPAPAAAAPTISSVVHNGRSSLNSGDTLIVTMNGDSGGQASFDVLGVVQDVPMKEISVGRYQGEYTVRTGTQLDRGTLVVHLNRSGREATQEARRPVSFNSGAPGRDPQVGNIDLFPNQGGFQENSRPGIGATLPLDVPIRTARLYLDGRDVTGQASFQGQTLTFVPPYDLPNGVHNVRLVAQDSRGIQQNRDWSFTVRSQQAYQPVNTATTVTNLGPNSAVPAVFAVQGQTAPFAQVTVRGHANRSLIPGVIGFQDRLAVQTVQADAAGRFRVEMDARSIPGNTPIVLELQTVDNTGRPLPSTRLDLIRR